MIQEEIAEEKYTKFSEEVWNSIEKELSLFQKKVTDCMIEVVGDLKKTKEEDFAVRPILDNDVILGQDFYLEMIRPLCVKKGFLPKKLPAVQDFIQYQPDADQQQLMEKNLQKKVTAENDTKTQNKKGKKGGKNNQPGRDQKMRMQIAKQNFNKDAELVFKSFSGEKLQIQFGFKQEKLELKLITFFYIAHFIKKNRVDLKIQEGTIFEFINILIKVARIYKGLKGPSFFNEHEPAEISPTLILDIRMCIDGMKDYYKYDNRKIIIKYPKLVYYTSYDKYFPTLDIKPYGSQIQFIQSCKKAFDQNTGVIKNPVLILYKPMIGSGKTTASIALSQIVRDIKYLDQKNAKFQLVYSCVVSSVRIQVGRYAYSKRQKFALAAMQNYIKESTVTYPRIINSWSCKNQKIVDLIISDPYCTYQMLDKNELSEKQQEYMEYQKKERKTAVNLGRIQRQNIALFIDQPTAYCRSTQSIATRKIFDILANHPPKLTILSSATMPEQQDLKNTIQLIRRKNPGLQVITISSKEFQIGCQYCNFRGDIVFPHTGAKTKEEIQEIINLLKNNAFLLRLYTGPSLFFLIKKCEKIGLSKLPKIDELPQVRQQDILKATFRILTILSKQSNDVIEQICKLSESEANIQYNEQIKEQSDDEQDFFKNLGAEDKQEEEKEEKEEQQIKEKVSKKDYYINFKKMLRGDAYKFLGGCLIGTADPIKFAHAMFDKWVGEIKPIKRLMDKYKRECEALQKEIRMVQADTEKNQEERAKAISKLISEKEVLLDFPNTKQINTFDHYKKYCKKKQPVHNTMLIKPVPASNIGQQLIDDVDDFLLKLLFCGVAIFKKSGLSPKYLDKVEELASLNYLAYIIADQSLCYGTNFPISNIILRDDLANILSMNDMFQFIGRAGRVGQSWTARAFLQGQGLVMLNKYIKKKDFRNSKQAQIFQQIAQQHLDNPSLKLRTLKSEIRYLNRNESAGMIEILIKKKKEQDADLIKKVSVVPFVVKEGKVLIFSKYFKFENINYYQFPNSEIYYDDLPTTKNSKDEEVIDVSYYYKQEVTYIQQTINNTVNRILEQYKDSFKVKNQINKFAGKVYVPYFCRETNTMTILVKVQDQSKMSQNFEFRQLVSSGSMNKDQDQIEKFTKITRQAPKIAKKFLQKPNGVVQNDIKQFEDAYSKLISNPMNKFYEKMVEYYKQKTKQDYNSALKRLESLDDVSEKIRSSCHRAIAAELCNDAINISDKNFFVDKNVRGVWSHIINVMQTS